MTEIPRPVSRIQWSKQGITFYDPEGSFICRLEQPWEVGFVSQSVMEMLKTVSDQQQKLRDAQRAQKDTAKAEEVTSVDAAPSSVEAVA